MLHFTKVTEKLEFKGIQRQASRTGKGSLGKDHKQTSEDLDVFSLQERLLIPEGLSHGKRPIIVFCGPTRES